MEKVVELRCEWCYAHWTDGDPVEDGWFTFIAEFGATAGEELHFCGTPCLLAYL